MTTAITTITEVRQSLERMKPELARALTGTNIDPAKFVRVSLTAIQKNQDLLECDRKTLYAAITQCAADGLIPDGREAAIVKFGATAQYMPMVAGILKKVRQSGQIATITARVVYAGDKYRYWIDDGGEHIEYEPCDDPDTSVIRRVFAMAKTKDGEIFVEPMTPKDIEKIRAVSRSKNNGPWVQWWDEMAKKSALRRMSKRLPMSTDVEEFFQRSVDSDVVFDQPSDVPAIDVPPEPVKRVSRMQAAIDATITVDEDGVIDDGFGELA